jgi:hypothetical protein
MADFENSAEIPTPPPGAPGGPIPPIDVCPMMFPTDLWEELFQKSILTMKKAFENPTQQGEIQLKRVVKNRNWPNRENYVPQIFWGRESGESTALVKTILLRYVRAQETVWSSQSGHFCEAKLVFFGEKAPAVVASSGGILECAEV